MHLLVVDPMLPNVLDDPAKVLTWWNRLAAARRGLTLEFIGGASLGARIADADGVAGFVPPDALAQAGERLKWVHSWAAGPQDQLYPEFVKSGVVLTCSKGNGAIPLAEHAMLLMLALARDLSGYAMAQAQRCWAPHLNHELAGSTCAILGAGHSARELARRARAFGMRVIAFRRSGENCSDFDQVFGLQDLDQFLGAADWLVNTLPRTTQTIGLLGPRELSLLKPTAFYVCVSRGGVVDDAALVKALLERRIAGAGLDAHADEPLPADSPFWSLPNTIVTPHDAAHCVQTHIRGVEILIDNLARFGTHESLRNVVDVHLGY